MSGGRRRAAALAALALASVALVALRLPSRGQTAGPAEQEIARPLRYEISVVLKLIQVAVVDKKGRPVRDLDRSDFLVFDNGKPVEITAFERHSIRPGAEPPADRPAAAPAAPMVPAAPAAEAPAMNRKFFILFDFAFNNPRGIGKAKEAALGFMDAKVGPEDEVAVLTYTMVKGLRVQEYLTRDHDKARKIIASIDRRSAAGRASEIEERFWREATEGEPPVRESAPGPGAPRTEYDWERQEAKRIAQLFILRLTDLAKALRYVQGRKDFLFFSSGVPSSMIYGAQAGSAAGGRTRFDAGDNVLRDEHEALIREFATSGCAFYAFDTRQAAKVASLFTYDEETFASGYRDLFSGSGVFGDQTSVFKDEQLTGRNSLQRLSQTTGGKYFGNIDSYDRSLEQVQDLTGTYYVLGFPVPEKEDGAYHEVRVEVKAKGLEVRGAGGYYNPKPFRDFNELERKLHLFDLAMNERALSRLPETFPMKVVPLSFADGAGLVVLGRVPRDLAAKLAGGPLELVSLVLDEEDNIHDMRRTEAPAAGQGALLFRSESPAKPGNYRCRLVIRNTVTGQAAVSSVAGTAVEARSGGLRVQPPILFSERREPVLRLTAPGGRPSGAHGAADLYPLDSDELVPVVGGLEPGRALTVVVPCEVLGGDGGDLKVNARLARTSGGDTVPVPFTLQGRERRGSVEIIRLGIPAGVLEPGSYNLYIFLQDPVSGKAAYGRASLTVSAA